MREVLQTWSRHLEVWQSQDWEAVIRNTKGRLRLAVLNLYQLLLNLITVEPDQDGWVKCPRCHWSCGHPSVRRGPIDFLAGLISLVPFRCRSCHLRYYRRFVPREEQPVHVRARANSA